MKKDLEALFYIWINTLKYEENKEYSRKECDYKKTYIFENETEFKKYFIKNGVNVCDSILDKCIMKVTKKGSIIALKGLCDHVITRYHSNSIVENGKIIRINNGPDVVNRFEKEYEDILIKNKTY